MRKITIKLKITSAFNSSNTTFIPDNMLHLSHFLHLSEDEHSCISQQVLHNPPIPSGELSSTTNVCRNALIRVKLLIIEE